MAHELLTQGLETLVDLGAKFLGGNSFRIKFSLPCVVVYVFVGKFSNEVVGFLSLTSNEFAQSI